MKNSGTILIVVMASIWAIICGGFAYDQMQRERLDLYHRYFQGDESHDREHGMQKASNLAAYDRELWELCWIVTPFFWVSLTISGYAIVAGLLLPTRWRHRRTPSD